MLELEMLNLDEIAAALSDRIDYEHVWLLDPRTGELAFWTSDTGLDGSNPVDLEDLDLVAIDPLPSSVWYRDMVEFIEGISDDAVGRRLGRAINGQGAFGRFKDELYGEYPGLVPAWQGFRDARAKRRAVEWLLEQGLIDEDAGGRYLRQHQDADLP
jgi:Uncharacterised protein family (UPF0158)